MGGRSDTWCVFICDRRGLENLLLSRVLDANSSYQLSHLSLRTAGINGDLPDDQSLLLKKPQLEAIMFSNVKICATLDALSQLRPQPVKTLIVGKAGGAGVSLSRCR